MNQSTSFQPVGDAVLSGKLPCCFPPFPAVWGDQMGWEAAFFNIKLHAARFRACVGPAAYIGVLLGVGGKPLLQDGLWVRIANMDKGVFLVKPNIGSLFLLGNPCSHKCSFLRPLLERGILEGFFLALDCPSNCRKVSLWAACRGMFPCRCG